MTSVQLATSDGHTLAADFARPPGGTDVVGVAVLCHPHPQYGGNRFNTVVTALYDAMPGAGFAALRFDFRRAFGGGVDERLDVVAALDHLDSVEALTGRPRVVVGYSFGAVIALDTVDERIAAVAAIAPPLTVTSGRDPGVPTLVLTPQHDQFSPPDVTEPIVRSWRTAELDVVDSADHFLAGRTGQVAERVITWLGATLRPGRR